MKKRDLLTEAEVTRLNEALCELDELHRRLFLSRTAMELGFGGISAVSRATGVARSTIAAGIRDIKTGKFEDTDRSTTRLRRTGAGRKRLIHQYPSLPEWIEAALEGNTSSTSSNTLRWTTQSLRRIADTIGEMHGIYVCPSTVATVLHDLGYLRHRAANTSRHISSAYKCHSEIQFRRIEEQTSQYFENGDPILSISSQDLRPAKSISPSPSGLASSHPKPADGLQPLSFPTEEYGLSDTHTSDNHATAACREENDRQIRFLNEAIQQWWVSQGPILFTRSSKLLMLCDDLNEEINLALMETFRQLSTRTGLEIDVLYFPTGICQWNAVVNELFVCTLWRFADRQSIPSRICLSSICASAEHPSSYRQKLHKHHARNCDES